MVVASSKGGCIGLMGEYFAIRNPVSLILFLMDVLPIKDQGSGPHYLMQDALIDD